MAALPPALTQSQIAGPHIATYESYYRRADPSGKGVIGALEAASFLKKSGLEESILSKIWDFSDHTGRGYLDKNAVFVALKLIALAQNGQEVTIANLQSQVTPPNMGDIPHVPGTGNIHAPPGSPETAWIIPVSERTKYDQIFDGLQPVSGLLSGDKVKPVLLNSKLPVDILGRVWDLSDIDKDGFLDREEFSVAMHLVYKALEKEPVPLALPNQLIPPSKRKRGGDMMAGVVQVMPNLPAAGAGSGRSSPAGGASSLPVQQKNVIPRGGNWVVSAGEKVTFDSMFTKADTDMDGLVGGAEVKDIFIQSGVHQSVLAHIWNLCDIRGSGKLNSEQFGLAMYLIQQNIQGIEPPQSLTLEMIPPSMRTQMDMGLMDGGVSASGSVAELVSSKELDTISSEIEELKRQKMLLEQDKAQKEADIKIRNTEVLAFEKELDAINNTLKQLENQKAEAQKRLDELDDKKTKLESTLQELKDKVEEEKRQIESFKAQINNQEANTKHQEEELSQLRQELNQQREQESELEQKVEAARNQLDTLMKTLDSNRMQVNEAKSRVQQLQESHKQLNQSITQYTAMINGEAVSSEVSTTPTFSENEAISSMRATAGNSPVSSLSGFSASSGFEDFRDDPFKSKDPFPNQTPGLDPFQNEDPFKQVNGEDPFKGSDPFKNDSGFSTDPFAESDPFEATFTSKSTSSSTTNQQINLFGSSDLFGGTGSTTDKFDTYKTGTSTTVGFDAFYSGTTTRSAFEAFESAFPSVTSSAVAISASDDPFGEKASKFTSSNLNSGDAFGSDPFAPAPSTSHHSRKIKSPAPAPPKSPVPSLPPKQKKMPPPRPPAPKSKSPIPGSQSSKSSTPDPFGGSDLFSGFDPFSVSSSQDPFSNSLAAPGNDPFSNDAKSTSGGGDHFANFADFSPSKFETSETSQLAWATLDSKRMEEDRLQRQQEQEQADLELAIMLSKEEMEKQSHT